MIEVEIIGGPRDGQRIALPDGVGSVRVALPTRLDARKWDENEIPTMNDPCYREVCMPIKLTRDGYRAYWKEPSC